LAAGVTAAGPVAADAVMAHIGQTYNLATTVSFGAGKVSVSETVTLTNNSTRSINQLNFSVLPRAVSGVFSQVGAVSLDGKAATTAWTNHTNLAIILSPSLAPGKTAVVKIGFSLDLNTVTGSFGTRFSKTGGILNLGNWFPLLSRAHDAYGIGDPQVSWAADMITLDLRTVENLSTSAIAAAGTLISSGPRHWVYQLAHARDYSLAISPSYYHLTTTVSGITLDTYTVKASGSTVLAAMKAATVKYLSWYGPMAYSRFVIAETGTSNFAQESPGLILGSADLIGSSYYGQYTIWHETAHQWWYNQVGDDQMASPWVDEGFAEFSARLGLGMSLSSCSTVNVDSSVFAWPGGLTTGSWSGCNGYFETVYHRSGTFLNALRLQMGNARFFGTLRTFQAAHKYGLVSSATLLNALVAGGASTSLIAQYTSR